MRRATGAMGAAAVLLMQPAVAGADALDSARGAAVIDMHLHAYPADAQGPPGGMVCAPYRDMPGRDARDGAEAYAGKTFGRALCPHPVIGAPDDRTLRERSLAMLAREDIVAVASGPAAMVAAWQDAAPDRIVPALEFGDGALPPVAELRRLHAAGRLKLLGEITAQYGGIAPDDARLEPYWALAEELDLPVGIHMGPGPPGAAYLGMTAYRMALTDPLLLEPVLLRHPRLRVYVMHAGWPMADRMIALMYAHPQVHVDTGVIDWSQPRGEFWAYLKRLVDAGYGKRIMFGSDQMVWPDTIPAALAAIRTAPFLTPAQKRDILHDNAARFLRLDERRAAQPSPRSAGPKARGSSSDRR